MLAPRAVLRPHSRSSGGTGKTRLALAVASAAGPSFSGACWVELGPISDPAVVGEAVATRLGVPGSLGRDTAESIAEHVGDTPLLLILDNCEHLTAAYHLLGTVRDYARERLAEAGEAAAARQAHLRCYVSLVEEAGTRIDRGAPGQGPGGLERELDRLDAETPNIRAALGYARESGDSIGALRIAGALGQYAYLRGHYHEVRQWMDAAAADGPDAPAALRATVLLGSGRLATVLLGSGRLATTARSWGPTRWAAGAPPPRTASPGGTGPSPRWTTRTAWAPRSSTA